MNALILTGWGYHEYAAAAAAALRSFGGRADVSGISKRRLPEFLDTAGSKWDRIVILGVSLAGDAALLKSALEKLKKKRVKVEWISAFDAPEWMLSDIEGLIGRHVYDTSLLEATGIELGVDIADLEPYATESGKAPEGVGKYLELMDAAQFVYRNYQDMATFQTVVRYLAQGVKPEAWSPAVEKVVANYRRYGSRELVGKSLQMRSLQERINRVASHADARVLILGESGTGKETIAWQIHTKSPRKSEEFVAFNCASVNPELLESRFFGHVKGAFTGADRESEGVFSLANGGTLFLDEIGEMPLGAQGILLRVLEGGRFMRVGGKEEIEVDVRLVTATNRNLPERVREGKFRADLFQRLNVVQLRAPALREHKEDIADIANAWWRRHHAKKTLSEAQIAALMEYDYPGNVRELLNILDRATVLGEPDFEALVAEHREMNAGLADETLVGGAVPDDLELAIRHHVRRVYDKYGRNITKAAKALNVARNTAKKYL